MKIAVVGSGCAGLGATWLLNEYSQHEVHVYESDDRPGGHAHTVPFHRPDISHGLVDVDTCVVVALNKYALYIKDPIDVPPFQGIVLNPSTYPNFLRFLKLESIAVVPTEMTFSVSRDAGAFEWAGSNLFTVFCQPKNLLDTCMWRLIWDILRFNASARKLLTSEIEDPKLSIGAYLDREGYSDSFRDNYLIPMTAAIWSTPPDLCATDFPARTMIQFMNNHHLLQLTGKPSWLTLRGGSRVYVDRIISRLPPSQLHLSTRVTSVKTSMEPQTSVQVITADGQTSTYDHVILACHSDSSLKILEHGGQITPRERQILGGFRWTKNEAVLHFDTRLMPRRRLAWSSWNYLTSSNRNEDGSVKANINETAVTYWMNELQHISEEDYGPVLVTLNPPFEPHHETIVGRYTYDHPAFSHETWRSQRALASIQGTRGISYAGAWTAFGFHEDGFTSGLVAATAAPLSAHPPFGIQYPDRHPGSLWPAYIFDMLERTGARRLVAFFLVAALNFIRHVLYTGVAQRSKKAE